MKRIIPTMLLGAAAVAASASVTSPAQGTVMPSLGERAASLHEIVSDQVPVNLTMPADRQGMRRAESLDPMDLEIVSELPEGLSDHNYSGSSVFFALNGQGMMMYGPDRGHYSQICVDRDGGHVYIYNVFSGFPMWSYIVGDIEGDEVVFTFPQKVRIEEWENWDFETGETSMVTDIYWAYKTIVTMDSEGMSMNIDDQDPTIRFSLDADNNMVQQDDSFITLLGLMNMPDQEGNLKPMFGFTGFAESQLHYDVFDYTEIELPADLEFDKWIMLTEDNSWMVDVAIDGNDFYVRGIGSGMWLVGLDNMVLKGEITEGQVSFPSRQFVGVDTVADHWSFFFGSTYEMIPQPGGDDEAMYTGADALVLTWDEATHTLVCADNASLSISSIPDGFWLLDCLNNPELRWQDNKTPMTPVQPEILEYAYWEEYGYGAINFNMEPVSTDGRLLFPENYYYQVLIDGEPMTFYPDEYIYLEEPMTEIGYDYFDPYFVPMGVLHAALIYTQGMDTIGVQGVYHNPDGSVTYSEPSILDVARVGAAESDREVAGVEYYDLAGRRVDGSAKGIVLKRTLYTDGTSVVCKKVNK